MKKIFLLMFFAINLTCSELQSLQPSLHSTLARPVLDRELTTERRKYWVIAHLASLIPFSSCCCNRQLNIFLDRLDATYDAESVKKILNPKDNCGDCCTESAPVLSKIGSTLSCINLGGIILFNSLMKMQFTLPDLANVNIYLTSLSASSLCCSILCHNSGEKQRDIRERIQRRYNLPYN